MKLLQLSDLKKNNIAEDSYQGEFPYKGRRVKLLLDHYSYTLEQALARTNLILPYLDALNAKAKTFLAQEDFARFLRLCKERNKPEVCQQKFCKLLTLSTVQFFDESIDFFYHLSTDKSYDLIVGVCLDKGIERPTFEQWFIEHTFSKSFFQGIRDFFKGLFSFTLPQANISSSV